MSEFASIDRFMSQFKNGFAKANLFEVTIYAMGIAHGNPANNQVGLKFACHSAQIPGLTLATTDKDIGFRSVAYRKIYDDINLSFYCSETMNELEFFQDWMKAISPSDSNRVKYYSEYVADIDITQFNRNGEPTLQTKLIEAYPKKIDATALDYSTSNALMSINVSLTYRHYTQHWFHPDSSKPKNAQGAAAPFRWTENIPNVNPTMGILTKESQDRFGHGGNDDTGPGEF